MSVFSMSLPLVGAASATSGLIFVFLGLTSTRLQSLEIDVQRIVAPTLVLRSWIAFVGLLLSTAAAVLSLFTMWWKNVCVIWIAFGLWTVALVCVIISAAILVTEVHNGS